MTNPTIEIPESNVRTLTLKELRAALNDKIENKDKKLEIEEIIDKAIKVDGEKKMTVEITKEELEDFITQERFDEIQEKIIARKETVGFLKKLKIEFEDKKESIKPGLIAGIWLTGPMILWWKIKSSIEGVKNTISGAWTWVKKGWYKFLAFFGNDKAIEKLAALEENEKTKKEEKEGKEKNSSKWDNTILMNIGKWLLGWTAIGLLLKNLPPSILEKLWNPTENIRDFFMNCAENPELKLFWESGIFIFGLWNIIKASEDPEVINKLGKFPDENNERKTWIMRALDIYGWLGEVKKVILGAISSGWDLANGTVLNSILEKNQEEPPEWMMRLSDKLMPINKYLDNLDFELRKSAAQWLPLIATLSLLNPKVAQLIASGWFTLARLSTTLIGILWPSLLKTGLILSVLMNGYALAGHLKFVPKDKKEFADYLKMICQLPETKKQLKERWISTNVMDDLDTGIDSLSEALENPSTMDQKLSEEWESAKELITEKSLSIIAPGKNEVIQQKTIKGFQWFKKNLDQYIWNSENPREIQCIEKIKKITKSIEAGEKLQKADIDSIIRDSKDTNINITITKLWYVNWCIKNDDEIVEVSDYLCVNPAITSENEIYEKSRKMALNSEWTLGNISAVLKEWFFGRFKDEMRELKEAIENNNVDKWASTLEKFVKNGCTILFQAWKFVLWDGGVKSFILPFDFLNNAWKKFTWEMRTQEFLVETVDWLVPMIVIGSVGNLIVWKRFGIMRAVVSSPLYLVGKSHYKIGDMIRNKIIEKRKKWLGLIDVLDDPGLIKEPGYKIWLDKIKNIKLKKIKISSIPRKRLKGIAGILSVLWISAWSSSWAESQNKEEIRKNFDSIDREWETIDEIKNNFREIWDSLWENEDNEKIQAMLSGDPNFFMTTNNDELWSFIEKIYPVYTKSILNVKKVCSENKDILKWHFAENPENKDKKERIWSYMSVSLEGDNLSLDTMSYDKFKKHFYSIYNDLQKDKNHYKDDWQQSDNEKKLSLLWDNLPITGSWRDSKTAINNFQQWDWYWFMLNGGMAALGWSSDALLAIGWLSVVVSGPIWPAAWAGASAWIRWAISAIRASKFAKNVARMAKIKNNKYLKQHSMLEFTSEQATTSLYNISQIIETDQHEIIN